MVASRTAAEQRANRLLGLLSLKDYRRLRPHLHQNSAQVPAVSLPRRQARRVLSISLKPGSAPW